MPPVKYWEIVADKLSAAGWTWGYCSAVTEMAGVGSLMPVGETVAVTFVQTSELLSAFLELAKITRVRRCFFRALGVWPITKLECGPIVGGLSCTYEKRFLRGLCCERFPNENMMGETSAAAKKNQPNRKKI